MKLEYISHSCFAIESGRSRLVFDPWISPTAYNKQWYLFPEPVNKSVAKSADIIVISHGHEDHLNTESLRSIQKKASVYFPFQWRKGIVEYFKHLGFSKITEATSFNRYKEGPFEITYLSYSLESVIVIECEGNVIVNINDALNSNHETAADFMLKEIKSRWPHIDYLLSGWSGAGYFPNKVHYKGKNDQEVARLREQYFANNFCKFAHYLQPEIAIAFAPGFVLLQNENRWINEIKFPREVLDTYYRDNFDKNTSIQFPLTYPGDYFIDKSFNKVSEFHNGKSDKDIYRNLEMKFTKEIAEANYIEIMTNDEVNLLMDKLEYWLYKNKSIYHSRVIDDVVFSIQMLDVNENSWLNISFEHGLPRVTRSDTNCVEDRLLVSTRARLLSLNFDKPWGGDLLSIGYGISVQVFDELSLEKNLDIVCVRLISRFPKFSEDFVSNTDRIFKYYLSNPSIANLWINQKIKLRPYVNKYPFNERDHWITFNKCELCKVCNMKEVEFDQLEAMYSSIK